MKHILLISLPGLLVANAYSAIWGESSEPAEPLAFHQVDVNQDGAISRQEASSFSAIDVIFASADSNKDGILDSLEYPSSN